MPLPPILERYLDKVIHDNRAIDARGVMQVNRMIELTMDEVFINLSVRMGHSEKSALRFVAIDKSTLVSREEYERNFDSPPTSERLVSGIETGVATDDLWSRHNAWVLLGDPGAGKTTILKHFALQSAREYKNGNGHLPIFLPLRLLAAEWEQQARWKAQDVILKYLYEKGLPEIGFGQLQERQELLDAFAQALESGRALLLFDGMDEQRNREMQKKTVAAIESLYKRKPANRFIVSSRIIGYDAAPLGSAFNTATLEPFTDEQMEKFFHQWIYAVEKQEDIVVDDSTKNRAEEKAAQLIAQIESNPGIRSLATNPLLCTIIGLIRRQGATLPQLRAELYKLCIDTFIFNWELQKRHRSDQQGSLDKDQTQAVLEEIALRFHEGFPQNRAPQEKIVTLISDFQVRQEGMEKQEAKHKAQQLLSLIRDVSGLLINRGNNEYGFFHLTFQEYLAARAITRKKRDIDRYLQAHLFEPRWREVIRLAAAHQGMKDQENGSEFIDAIRRCTHPREPLMHYVFRIAFLCLKEAQVELETSDQMFREWVSLYLKQPELQYLLRQLLTQPGGKIHYRSDALHPLLDALTSQDTNVRLSTVGVLHELNDPTTLQPLIRALKDQDGDVRSSAADALGKIKNSIALQPLIEALKDQESEVRSSAAWALSDLKAPAALPFLIDALRDQDDFTRYAASYALGKFHHSAVLPLLSEELKSDLSHVRLAAAETLGNLNAPESLPLLINALKDQEPNVRHYATYALAELKNPDVQPALINALKNEDSNVRSGAAWALYNFKEPSTLSSLIDALKDQDSEVRSSAARALGNFKEPAALQALVSSLPDEDNNVHNSIMFALGRLNHPAALPHIVAALKDQENDSRVRAAYILGEISDPASSLALAQALKNQDTGVVHAAIHVLGMRKDLSTLPYLIDAFKDKNCVARNLIANALSNFKDPAALHALIGALKDNDRGVRSSAASVLHGFKEPAALGALLEALKDEDDEVRSSAAYAIGEFKDPSVLSALLEVLKNDDNSNVRSTAARSIELIDLGGELCPD